MKSSGRTETTNRLDPETERMRSLIYDAARRAAGSPAGGTASGSVPQAPDLSRVPPQLRDRIQAEWTRRNANSPSANAGPSGPGTITGVDPQTQAAIDFFSGSLGFAQRGQAALGGDAAAAEQFMNPYRSGVLDAVTSQFDDARTQAQLSVDDMATKAGAFGGSRHGVALGVQLGELGKQEAQTKAQLTHAGFETAMQRALQSANLGFGAAAQLPGLGQFKQIMDSPELRTMKILAEAMSGMPYGTTSTTKEYENWLKNVIGFGTQVYGMSRGRPSAPAAA